MAVKPKTRVERMTGVLAVFAALTGICATLSLTVRHCEEQLRVCRIDYAPTRH
jgi:hypothetical protein